MNEAVLIELATRSSGAGVWVLVFIAVVTLIKGWPALKKLSIEADGSLRKDLLERISLLENELRDERRSCDTRMSEQKKQHDEAIAELQGEVNGLRRQMVQWQQSSGHAMLLGDYPARAVPHKPEGEESERSD